MTLYYQFLLAQLKKTMFFLAFCFVIFSNTIFAKDELVVAVGLAKPPYVIQSENSGFELDLIHNILKKMGKSAKFIYTPFGHSSKMLEVEDVDVIMTTNQTIFGDNSKLSDVYITYQNVAVSLKSSDLTINKIKDLVSYSIASFQKANKILGKDFADVVDQSPQYLEVEYQSQQLMLLLKKRVDVVIMDKNIFNYYAEKLSIKDKNTLFTFHKIFPETNYRIAFKNKQYVQIFNDTLAQYKQTDEYLLLKKSYNL
jgi:polar amino acid transport system substrate-binding protein